VSKKNRRGRERQGKLVGWNVRDQKEEEKKRTNKQVKQTFLGGPELV
jgi:hypothetical protein